MFMLGLLTFLVVLLGWLLSLALHEFSHALVAYRGGDWTVKEKGYLEFNLLKYTHPVYSIFLPLLFLVMGGIGLPGGAVYIETWRIRSPWWLTAVSLAGPLSNMVVAIVLALILQFDFIRASMFGPGLAFLALLQVSATLFNLIPLPPFDGYGALRPHLAWGLREQLDRFGQYSMLVVFALFWLVRPVGEVFWGAVGLVSRLLGIPVALAVDGLGLFRFWEHIF